MKRLPVHKTAQMCAVSGTGSFFILWLQKTAADCNECGLRLGDDKINGTGDGAC